MCMCVLILPPLPYNKESKRYLWSQLNSFSRWPKHFVKGGLSIPNDIRFCIRIAVLVLLINVIWCLRIKGYNHNWIFMLNTNKQIINVNLMFHFDVYISIYLYLGAQAVNFANRLTGHYKFHLPTTCKLL
jgi:hypothetical protein